MASSLKLLSTEGHEKLNINKLAKALGVSKGSFYWHFKNREDFIQSLIDYHTDTFVRSVVRFTDKVEGDAQERLWQLVSFIIGNNLARYNIAMHVLVAIEPKFMPQIRKSYRIRIKYVSSLFEEIGFQDKELETRVRTFVIFMTNEATFLIKKSKKERLALARLALNMFTAPQYEPEKGG